jgi:hypothetical protein
MKNAVSWGKNGKRNWMRWAVNISIDNAGEHEFYLGKSVTSFSPQMEHVSYPIHVSVRRQ